MFEELRILLLKKQKMSEMDGLPIFCEDKNPLLKLPAVSITESGGA